MSRPRKSDNEKKLKGTFKKSRENNYKASLDEPVADLGWPIELQDNFNLIVHRLKEQDRASASYTEIIEIAARKLTEMRQYEREIAKHGMFVDMETVSRGNVITIRKENPMLKYRKETSSALRQALNDLGLTPTSLGKVKQLPKKKDDKGWDLDE